MNSGRLLIEWKSKLMFISDLKMVCQLGKSFRMKELIENFARIQNPLGVESSLNPL